MRFRIIITAILTLACGALCMLRAVAAEETIFSLAAQGDAAAVGRLLDADQTLLSAKDAEFGATALHFAASQGRDAVVSLLLKRGADPNLGNNEAQTPLHLAALKGQKTALALLLAAAQPNVQEEHGDTPLHYAAASGQYVVIKSLLAAKADVELEDHNGQTPMMLVRGNPDIVELLAEGIRPGATLLVDLDARDASAGAETWVNRAGLGPFTRMGPVSLQTIAGVRAVCLDGISAAYRGPLAPVSIAGNEPRTVEVWVNNPGPEIPGKTIVAWGNRSGEGYDCAYCYGFNASISAFQGIGDRSDVAWALAGRWTPQGFLSLQLNQWHCLSYVYDGKVMRAYLDGELNIIHPIALRTTPEQPIMLGAQNDTDGAPVFHDDITGPLYIASVRVWSGIATPEQILQSYNRRAKRFRRTMALPFSQPDKAPVTPTVPQYPLGHANFYPSPAQPVGYHGDGNGAYPGAVIPAEWREGTHIERVKDDDDGTGTAHGTYPDFADTVAQNIVWKTQMPSWANSHPIVVGNKVYTLGEPDYLYCVDARTGALDWTRCVNPWEIAGIDKAKAKQIRELYDIYLALRAFERLVQNGPFSPGNFPLSSARYRPLAENFLTNDYPRITAALKRLDPEKETDYQAAGDQSVAQIQTLTASTVDDITTLTQAQNELPLQKQVRERILALSGVFHGIPLDMAAWNFGGFCLPSPVSDGMYIYVAFGQGQTCCFDLQGNMQWGHLFTAPEVGWVCSYLSPVLADGVLIDERGNHALRGLDAVTGRLLWETSVAKDQDLDREDPFGNDKVMSLSNGKESLTVLVTSRGAILRVVDGKIVGTLPLPSTQWEGASVAGIGSLVFKTGTDPNRPFRTFKLTLESRDKVRAELVWERTGWGDSCGGILLVTRSFSAPAAMAVLLNSIPASRWLRAGNFGMARISSPEIFTCVITAAIRMKRRSRAWTARCLTAPARSIIIPRMGWMC